jgi:hypothetical protein
METSAKRLKDLEMLAPETMDVDPKTNKKITVCLSWHLLGQCYDNCRRVKSHRKLTTAEEVSMQQVVENHLQE